MADWPDGIDMDALLAPVAEDAPTGEDLRKDLSAQSVYLRLRDAQMAARDAERQEDARTRDDSAEPLPVLWRQVRGLAIEALGKSKNLDVAAWLTEALVRSDGPLGLATGAHLMAQLAERYWDSTLYPIPEYDDETPTEVLVASVTGLNGQGSDGTLAQPLRKFVLFSRPDGTEMTFWQYQASEQLATVDAARAAQRIEQGVVPLDTVQNEARAAGQAHFAALRAMLQMAHREWVAMGAVFDAKAGTDSPSTRAVRELLEGVLEVVGKYAPPDDGDAGGEVAGEAMAAGGVDGAGAVAGGGAMPRGPLVGAVNREDMLKELARIADYFRRTEPQSPLAYTLEEAIRRGRMTWPELLAEIVTDTTVRDGILMQLGIRPPAPADGEEGGGSADGGW